ncbi:MAG: hypothetical protein KGH76_04190 [Thaumarchaeota archaeon]|nr:hypothetical protein [Nitrososphaerota archaeon]
MRENLINGILSDSILFKKTRCPICRKPFTEHSGLQEQICRVIMTQEFSGNCPGFNVENWPGANSKSDL